MEALDDEAAYQPEVMNVRGAIKLDAAPSFGQVWALGFMFAVGAWPQEWAAPRDKEAVKWLNGESGRDAVSFQDFARLTAKSEDHSGERRCCGSNDEGLPWHRDRKMRNNGFALTAALVRTGGSRVTSK